MPRSSNHEVEVSAGDPGSGSSVNVCSTFGGGGLLVVDLKRIEHIAKTAHGRRLEPPLRGLASGVFRMEGRKGNREN